MPRLCTICHHPKREAIDKALLSSDAGYRKVAKRFDVSPQSLYRHRTKHLPVLLARALAKKPPPVHRPVAEDPATDEYALQIACHQDAVVDDEHRHAIDVMQQLRAINVACLEVLRKARESDNHPTLLRAVDRIHRQIELQARLLGDIDEGPNMNVLVMPEWHRVRQLVVDALRPFPEARTAVAEALRNAST